MRYLTTSVALLLLATAAHAEEDSTLKQDAKEVGHKTGEVVHKVGETGKEVGKKIGETGKKVGKTVAKTAVEVGHATRDGAKEFAKTVKEGVKGDGTSSSASSTLHQK